MGRTARVVAGSLVALLAVSTGIRAPAGASVRAVSAKRFLVFVALEGANEVAVMRGPPWQVVRRIAVPRAPHNAAASADGRYAAVTSPPADEVTFFDRTGRTIRSISVPGYPHDLVFASGGRALWVTAEQGSRLVELAVPSGRVLRSVATAGRPHDLDLQPADRLWVTLDGSRRVEVRSAVDGRLLADPDLGRAPHDVAVAPGGRTVWFTNWSSGVLTEASTTSRRPLAALAAGRETHHFAFGDGLLWVSDNRAGTLIRIDPGRRRVLGRTAVGPAPHHAVVVAGDVLVAVHGSGRIAVVARGGSLVETIPVGAGPHGVAAVPAGP